jgi:hypothetical protein
LRRALAIACALAAASCTRSGTLVVVTVDAAPALPTAATLAVNAVAPARFHMYMLPLTGGGIPPERVFGLEVPPDVTGPLSIHVEALDASGASLAAGDGMATLASGGGRSDVHVLLGAGGPDAAIDLGGRDAGDAGPLDGAPDLAGTCVKHSDCASTVCRADHTCAPPSDVAWVDNGGQTTASCIATGTHDGTSPTTAFCSIPPALDSGRSYVRVAGSTAHYGALAANSSTWNGRTVIGPGLGATPPATIFADGSAGADALQFSISMLTFDGMDFSGQVDCTAVGTIALVGVSVHDSIADGVYVGGCNVSFVGGTVTNTAYSGVRTNTSSASATLVDVTLSTTATSTVFNGAEPTPAAVVNAGGAAINVDRCKIGPGNGVGLLLGSGTYSVTNTFIVDNVGAFAVIGQGGTGVFQFNTVANNKRGVNCNNNVLEASIFYNNQSMGSEFNSMVSCSFPNGTTTSASAVQPIFLGATDYRLDPTSSVNGTCCIDQVHGTVDGGATQLTDHDYFLDKRPLGGGWDVGAHEAR